MSDKPKGRVGILISGRGSNMEAIADACKREDFPAEVGIVVSNEPDAPGLQKARVRRWVSRARGKSFHMNGSPPLSMITPGSTRWKTSMRASVLASIGLFGARGDALLVQ